jgi:hypothetical protein
MIKELLARGGAANIRDIAAAFLARDESQLEYYEQITKDMPGKVFAKHGIVKRDAALVRAPCVIIRTVINGFTFDGATKDPMQQAVRDALIAFMAAMSQAQAGATKAAQRAGIEHAKQNDEQSVPHVSEPCPSWRPVNGPSPGGK